jgi:RimJ/RimL family protein N-acetyltransferase
MDLQNIDLENAFVRLELLAEGHREALRHLANDETLWVQTTLNAAQNFDLWFDTMLASNAKGDQISYAVFDKPRGVYAGHTSFLSISSEHRRLEIGWTWYGADFHRIYINPSCKNLLMAHAFKCGAERVELKTGGENIRSQKAMEKMGAKCDGVLRSHSKTWRGERRDSVFYSVLADEWEGVREGLERRLQEFGQ